MLFWNPHVMTSMYNCDRSDEAFLGWWKYEGLRRLDTILTPCPWHKNWRFSLRFVHSCYTASDSHMPSISPVYPPPLLCKPCWKMYTSVFARLKFLAWQSRACAVGWWRAIEWEHWSMMEATPHEGRLHVTDYLRCAINISTYRLFHHAIAHVRRQWELTEYVGFLVDPAKP